MDTFINIKNGKYPSKFISLFLFIKIFSVNGITWDVEEMKYLKSALQKIKIHPQKEEKQLNSITDEVKLQQSANSKKIQPLKNKVLRVRGR